MICPYCEQGSILKARVKKNNKIIYICDECDTVWESIEEISDRSGKSINMFMQEIGCEPYWDELELME